MKTHRLAFFAIPLACIVSSGCGDDDGQSPRPDARVFDAAIGTDSAEILPDAAPSSICGFGDKAVQCDVETEICVVEDLGGSLVAECQKLAGSCEAERNCQNCSELCQKPADTCDDSEEENTIHCVCLEC